MNLREGGKRIGRTLGIILLVPYAIGVGAYAFTLYESYTEAKGREIGSIEYFSKHKAKQNAFIVKGRSIEELTDFERSWIFTKTPAQRRQGAISGRDRDLNAAEIKFLLIPLLGLLSIVVYKLPIWVIGRIVWIIEGFQSKD